MCHLDEQIEFASPIKDETNCCFFLKLKICDSWLTYSNNIKHKWKPGTKSVEGIIQPSRVKTDPCRDSVKC